MANGIELRDRESVVAAYREYGHPNFMILSGREPRMTYDGDMIDEGIAKLNFILDIIEDSQTAGTYSMRVYPEGTTKITNSTAYPASCRFMLNSYVPLTKNENGVVVVQRGSQAAAPGTPTDVQQRLDRLEQENKLLLDKLTDQRIDALKKDFEHRISGLQNQAAEKSNWDKFFDFVDKVIEKPDVLEKVGSAIGKVIHNKPRENYIVHSRPPYSNVAGTNSQTMEDTTTPATEATAEQDQEQQAIPYVNKFLTEEEKQLPADQQGKLMRQRLEVVPEADHEDVQNEALESIQSRIGAVTLSRLLIAVASMDDSGLNKLINYLD